MLVVALVLFVLTTAVPMTGGATAKYLTTDATLSSAQQKVIGGYDGVLINYTSAIPSDVTVVVYLDLVNQAGQTVYWNSDSGSLHFTQTNQCFVLISSAAPSGTYGAYFFATTSTGVPISAYKGILVTV